MWACALQSMVCRLLCAMCDLWFVVSALSTAQTQSMKLKAQIQCTQTRTCKMPSRTHMAPRLKQKAQGYRTNGKAVVTNCKKKTHRLQHSPQKSTSKNRMSSTNAKHTVQHTHHNGTRRNQDTRSSTVKCKVQSTKHKQKTQRTKHKKHRQTRTHKAQMKNNRQQIIMQEPEITMTMHQEQPTKHKAHSKMIHLKHHVKIS